MPHDLRSRLSALLDVLQSVHGINRRPAARIIGMHIGRGFSSVLDIATGAATLRPSVESRLSGALAPLEMKYALPLQRLAQYRDACRRAA